MKQFIMVRGAKHEFNKIVKIEAINYVFENNEQAYISTNKKILNTGLTFSEVKSHLLKLPNFKHIDINEDTIRGLEEKSPRPINAIINLNRIQIISEGWQGRIVFIDNESIESTGSFGGLLIGLDINYDCIIK